MKKLLAIILLPLFIAAQSQQSQSIELPEFVITGQQKISLPIMKKSKAKPVQLFSKDVQYQTFTPDQFSLTTVSMPVRQPALLFKETKSFNNHLVLGAGQYTLPTGHFYFSQPFSHAKLYANLKGVNIKDYEEYADYNRSYINLGSEFYISRTSSFLPYAIIGVDAEFDRREFHFYSNLRQPGSTPARRELQRGKAKISLSNYAGDIFDYQFAAGGNYLNIIGTNIEEILFDFKAETRIKYSDFSLLLGGEYKLQQLDKYLLNENYNFVFAKGALEYHLNSKMKIFAGAKYYLADVREVVNPLFISPMSKQNESLIYPFGGLDYSVSNMLSINVKYDPYAVYSTINDFLNKNRFTFVGNKSLDHSSFILIDNNLKKVDHHIHASLKFGYKKYYEVTVGATFSKIDNQPYFTNDYSYNNTFGQPEFFYVDRVSDVTGYSLFANALYHLGPFGWFYGDAKFEVLETSSNKRIPYKPLLSLDAAYGYKFDFGLSAEIKVKYWYKYYRDIANSDLFNDYINLSSELKYSLTGNFDLTLQLNNLLNRDQELWSGYLEPPFDIIAGFDFRF